MSSSSSALRAAVSWKLVAAN